MSLRRLLPCAVLMVAGALLLSRPVSSSQTEKISARVLQETANGGSTEALVVLAEQADLSPASALQTKLEKGRYVVSALRTLADRTQGPILNFLRRRGVSYQSFYIVNMIKVTGNRALMEELAERAEVAQIDANPRVRTALPQPTGFDIGHDTATIEWNVQRVKAPQVWKLGFRGDGMVVAGADTGVQWDHPALKKQYRGWNGQQVNHDYNWHDATPEHSPTPVDPFGHGTFTVSEMDGYDGGNNVLGVAPGARWIACRNMDAGGTGSPTSYSECFEFLMAPYPVGGNPRDGDPTKAPDSINNSWGCPPSEGCSTNTLLKVVNAVRAAGIFPAMAAGNSGSNCSSVDTPPAIYAGAVSVGATNSANQIAGFSSRGPVTADGSNRLKPELSAPGQSIRGAVPGNQYQGGWSGTSMAAPHVAGGVALIWQAKPSLKGKITNTEILYAKTALHLKSSQDCGGSGQDIPNNVFGYGLINLYKAVTAP
jgi:serine protease AprX